VVDVGNDGEVADEFHGAPWSRSPSLAARTTRASPRGRRESSIIAWKSVSVRWERSRRRTASSHRAGPIAWRCPRT
jgi:hypothetical protein